MDKNVQFLDFDATLEKIKASIPSDDEFEELAKKHYEELLENKNNYSYWYNLIDRKNLSNNGIKIVDSKIFLLDYEHYRMIGDLYELRNQLPTDEFYQSGKYKLWQNHIKSLIQDLEPHIYNIKTQTFSNKFEFENSISYKDDIPSKILDIMFKDFEVEAEGLSGFIVRDLIKSDIRIPCIYKGMPLNSEFRVFYDFDEDKLLYSVNYWNYDYCKDYLIEEDDIVFKHEEERLNKSFEENQGKIESLIKENAKYFDLEGKWSIDLMITNNQLYLIDMALANQSAYWRGDILDA